MRVSCHEETRDKRLINQTMLPKGGACRPMSRNRQRWPDPTVFLTELELACRWRHSPRSLQRWRAAGKGPPYLKVGRRVIYRISVIEAEEARREVGE
jgi:hypothetical protein